MPPESSIVVDKDEVENDDHLKSVIKQYFKKQVFIWYTTALKISYLKDLSVKSISGTTFVVDIEYEQTNGNISKGGSATVKIEKTADSYKIISFDRKL